MPDHDDDIERLAEVLRETFWASTNEAWREAHLLPWAGAKKSVKDDWRRVARVMIYTTDEQGDTQ